MLRQIAISLIFGFIAFGLPALAVNEVASAATAAGFDRIEAEAYSSASGRIMKQPSGDTQDPTNLGLSLLTRNNTLAYNIVQFGTSSAISLDIRFASAVNSGGGRIDVRSGSTSGKVVGTVVVPKTGSWQAFKTIRVPLPSSLTGTHKITFTFSAANANPFVSLNWFKFNGSGPTPTPTPTPAPETATRPGFGRIEAESYDAATGSILKQPSGDSQDAQNQSLALLSRANTVTYSGIGFGSATATGVGLRLASAVNDAGGTVDIRRGDAAGPIVGSIAVPKTGSWQDFRTVQVPLVSSLSGTQKLTVTFKSNDANPFVNLNWLQFIGTVVPTTPTPMPTPTPTVSSGFVVKFVNHTGQPDNNVFLTADTGGVGSANYTGSVGNRFQPGLGRSVALTDLNGPGTDPSSHTYSFIINGYSGGRIYYSIGRGFSQHWPSAHDEAIPFDMVELNVNGSGQRDFFGDLSAMEQIGIPANLKVLDSLGNVMQTADGPAERNIACYQDVYDDLFAHSPYGWDVNRVKSLRPNGELLRLVGPNADPSRYPSMREYVESLHGQTLRIKGRFGGTGSLAGAYYDYSSYVDGQGNLLLHGTLMDPNDPSKPNPNYPRASTMFVAANDLWSNATSGYTGYGIYLQNGPFTLDPTVTGDGHSSPYAMVAGTGNTQAIHNDLYGWLYGDLVTAYAYGYWGGKYGNDSSNFDGKAPFGAARSAPTLFAAWNIWEQAIWDTSDSYGMALGERFGSGGKRSPLIGVGKSAAAMQVTLKGGCGRLR